MVRVWGLGSWSNCPAVQYLIIVLPPKTDAGVFRRNGFQKAKAPMYTPRCVVPYGWDFRKVVETGFRVVG